jgi:hypothetical protein
MVAENNIIKLHTQGKPMVINGQERKYNTYVPCQGSLLAAT